MWERFRWLVWATKYRIRWILGEGASALGLALRVAIAAALLAGALQLALLGGAKWNEGILEGELLAILGPHMSNRLMEKDIGAHVRNVTGVEPSVRIERICPAPGPPTPLEDVADTCLLVSDVEYDTEVLWVTRRVRLHATEKVFRDTVIWR